MKPLNKNKQVEIRISSQHVSIFHKAQKLIEKNRIITSERDRDKFFTVAFGKSKPNQTLLLAAKKYKSKVTTF